MIFNNNSYPTLKVNRMFHYKFKERKINHVTEIKKKMYYYIMYIEYSKQSKSD